MYTLKEREIFLYDDGQGEGPRYADPLLIEDRWAELTEDQDDEAIEQQLKSTARQVSVQAHYKILDTIRQTFDVEPIDPRTGKGLTVQETFDLSAAFFAWRESLRKKCEGTPDTTPPSDVPPTSPSSDGTAST